MDTFKIKLIACIIMLIDHVGAVFFPDQFYLRLIGRCSLSHKTQNFVTQNTKKSRLEKNLSQNGFF